MYKKSRFNQILKLINDTPLGSCVIYNPMSKFSLTNNVLIKTPKSEYPDINGSKINTITASKHRDKFTIVIAFFLSESM